MTEEWGMWGENKKAGRRRGRGGGLRTPMMAVRGGSWMPSNAGGGGAGPHQAYPQHT